MKFDFKNILLGLLIGMIATSTFFLMVGEVETEIRIGSQSKNEKIAILFTEKDKIQIIDLEEAENISINIQEDRFDFKIFNDNGSELEELLNGKTLEFNYPEGLLQDEELDIKLIVID